MAGRPAVGLTAREIYEFDLAGFVILRGVLDPSRVAALNAAIDAAEVAQGRFKFPVLDCGDAFLDLATEPRVLGACRDLLGDRFRLDHAFGVQQMEGTSDLFEDLHAGPWANQGAYYYGWYGGRPRNGMISVGFVLEPSRTGDGGVVLVPGSHKQNVPLPGAHVFAEILAGDLDAWWVVNPTLEPGDVLIFTEATVHGTRRWRPTERRRRILYYKFSPAHMAWRDHAEVAQLQERARDEVERALLGPPYVGRYDEREGPVWTSHFRAPTLATWEHRAFRRLGLELPLRDARGVPLSRLAHLRRLLPHLPQALARRLKAMWRR